MLSLIDSETTLTVLENEKLMIRKGWLGFPYVNGKGEQLKRNLMQNLIDALMKKLTLLSYINRIN